MPWVSTDMSTVTALSITALGPGAVPLDDTLLLV